VARVWIRSRLAERDPEIVLRLVTDFDQWPRASDLVCAVEVERRPDGTEISTWEVVFGHGLLRWSERDWLELEENRARFELIAGDPHHFDGLWHVAPTAAGSTITFDAEFDLGMPSLAHVLDPIAVEAVEEAVESVLRGLFGDALELEFTEAAPAALLEI
jgi:ribosome-associated toxin RatA of RatAB toxin-antitoxin module